MLEMQDRSRCDWIDTSGTIRRLAQQPRKASVFYSTLEYLAGSVGIRTAGFSVP